MERGTRGKLRENKALRRHPVVGSSNGRMRPGSELTGGDGGGSSSSNGTKKPKFPLQLKILTDDVFDKFSSIRIPGSKKDRPALLHLKQSHCSAECAADAADGFTPDHFSDQRILALFEEMMEDMNLNEDLKAPLREKDFSTKKEMVLQYTSTASEKGSLKSRRQIFPQEFIYELKTLTDEKLVSCLESLRVSLTSNPVSWVENFGCEGLGLLLDILERLVETKHKDNILKKLQHKIIQCLKAFMNNKYGLERIMGAERSFSLLAKAIDPTQINMMTDALKLLSAICIVGDENILEKILESLTEVAEERSTDRFHPILEGLQEDSVHLQIACMQFINALVTTPDDLDFRLHIRNEFMRCGLKHQLQLLRCIKNDALDIQLKVFNEHKEEDMIEFSHRLDDIRSELDEANDVYNLVWNTVKDTSAESYFLSILQHLLLIRNDHFVRPLYFKLIEECVSQIVLHRSGLDPDFSYRKRLDVNFSHILDICIELEELEELERKASEFSKKFEQEFVAHQETKAQLKKTEEKISLLEAERKAYNNKSGSTDASPLTSLQGHRNVAPPTDAVPNLLPMSASSTGAVPPPPPPPPLPPSFANGSRNPPPFGISPPPPPPLLQGLPGAQYSPPPHVLPFGLKPRKEFKPEITMKRLNWSKIRPHEMNENCFWITADDGKYENTDLLCKLELAFCCQKKVKRDEDFEEKKPIKKRIKELKILDPKIAQNLSIFLGSFRMPYDEIKIMILEIDEFQLSESMIQNLIKHLPEQKQLNELSKLKDEYEHLSEPEQFAIVMSDVKSLKPRLSTILFKLQFEEQVNNLRPEIIAVSAACEEIKKSRNFGHLLELVLLMGNYMNAGSRNGQTYGFNLCSLCKLKDTKSIDQKTTLLHFLAEICEEKHPNVLSFVEDLQNLDKASRVSVENLEKSLKQMEVQLKQLEKDLETFPVSEDIHDKFVIKMSSFAVKAKEQFQKLSRMHSHMEKLYRDIMEYYAIDLKKVSVEEFLTDLNNFKTMFMQAAKDNVRRKEAEEKQKRARIAKEKAEKEKLEKRLKKKHLLEMKTESDETGVMDSLLAALQSGAAFRDRRKRAPGLKENPKAPMGDVLHRRRSLNVRSKEAYRETDPLEEEENTGVKAEVVNGETSRKEGTERDGPVSRGEAIPEVEALLARLRAL